MSSAPEPPRERPVTTHDFVARTGSAQKLVVVTAYDALFGRLVDESGVDAVLVGDSLANVVAGLESTLAVLKPLLEAGDVRHVHAADVVVREVHKLRMV